jgi:hypothetical protein
MKDQHGLYHHLQTLQQLNMAPAVVDTEVVHRNSDATSNVSYETIAQTSNPVGDISATNHASVPESRVWAMQKPELNAIIAALVFSLINGGANTVKPVHDFYVRSTPNLILRAGCRSYSGQSHCLFLHA